MKLSEFLEHRKICPICDNQNLTLCMGEHKNKAAHRYEENRLLIIRNMKGLRKNDKSYKIGYSLGLTDNSIMIEFYTKDDIIFNSVPITLLLKFKEINKNINKHVLVKSCASCHRYSYISNYFDIDYITNIIDFAVVREHYGLSKLIKRDKYHIYQMINNYNVNETEINCYVASSTFYAMLLNQILIPTTKLKFPFMKFTTRDEVVNRLEKLMVFS